MVLKVTVKTLDSRNHQFEIEDSSTVLQFKEEIQETVNVPSTEQRLIFCGRVLQDDKKLTEYDCNEKVIHLVRRPPPSLDNTSHGSSGASDSNNNESGSPDAHFEGNVLFNTMTLGADVNVGHVLRHIFTLQQALHTRPSDDGTAGTPYEPMSMTDTERHLHNAVRLLRITVNTINECFARIAALPPSESRPQGLVAQQPMMSSASSQTDLNRSSSSEQADAPSPNVQSREYLRRLPDHDLSLDDLGIESSGETSARSNVPRQSLTTDDLPQSENGTGQRFATPMRSQNETGRLTSLPFTRGLPELSRYLNIVNFASDLQAQFQGLARRYRQLISMSCRGGLIVPSRSTSLPHPPSSSSSSSSTTAPQSSTENQAQNIDPGSPLMQEARLLGIYVPRLMHHLSHLQHALSDFTVDFSTGRLLLCSRATSSRVGSRRREVSRPVNLPRSGNDTAPTPAGTVTNTPATDTQGGAPSRGHRGSSATRIQPVNMEDDSDTLTITATTIGLQPFPDTPGFFATSATSNSRSQPTFVMSSTPTTGIRIPVSIPMGAHGTISVDITSTQMPTTNDQPQGAGTGPQQQSTTQPRSSDRQDQQPQQQGTTSNSTTQTSSRPIGVISGRVPLPFDYYLPCFSPWANYNATSRSGARATEVPPARIHIRAPRQQPQTQSSAPPASDTATSNRRSADPVQISGNITAMPPLDFSLISDVVNTILRPPGQQRADQNPQQNSTNSSEQQDSFLNILPELALNAASQILGGVLGLTPTDQTNANPPNQSHQQQQQQQQPTQQPPPQQPPQATSNTNTGTVMMDIDVDDGPSWQSEPRYHDARDSQSPVASASTERPLSPQRPEMNASDRYDRRLIQVTFQNHPEWIPVIEADILTMSRDMEQQHGSRQASGSGASTFIE